MHFPSFVTTQGQPTTQPKTKRGLKVGKKLKMVETIYCALPADQGGEETFLAMAACAGVKEDRAREHYRLAFRLARRGK